MIAILEAYGVLSGRFPMPTDLQARETLFEGVIGDLVLERCKALKTKPLKAFQDITASPIGQIFISAGMDADFKPLCPDALLEALDQSKVTRR